MKNLVLNIAPSRQDEQCVRNGKDGQKLRLSMVHDYPKPAFHTTLILNTPSFHNLPSIQASNNRFCPIGCAHHRVRRLVHHRRSA